jgi:hypothetical protein
MSIDLSGYNIEFDYTLIPMGSRYWITNAKVGSRYLSQYVSDIDTIKYIKITPTSENSLEDKNNIELSGVKFLATIKDSNHDEIKLTKDELKFIMNRCSVWVIRNPFDRFITGVIQKTKQFFEELYYAYHNPTILDWTTQAICPGITSHSTYPIDYTFLFENYKLINTERINENDTITIKWFSIWKDFCYELFTDILKYNVVNRSFTGDVHTQPYLYKLHMLFTEFNILSNLEIIDINDLDSRNDLFELELGKAEFEKTKLRLREWYSKTPAKHKAKRSLLGNDGIPDYGVVTRTEEEYVNFIRESNNMFKNIELKELTDYFKDSAIYSMEMVTYLMLLKNKPPQ